MIKSIKIRLFPTAEQEQKLKNHISCCRFIWNKMVEIQENKYKEDGRYIDGYSMIRLIKEVKMDFDFLSSVNNSSLQRVCLDLENAYMAYYRKVFRKPKFKKKKYAKKSYPVSFNLYFLDNLVHVPNVGKVKYRTDMNVPIGNKNKFKNPRISLSPNNKWILTVGIEYDNQVFNDLHGSVGIDLGIKELAVVAHEDKKLVFHNINKSRYVINLNKKLNHLNRVLHRKYKTNKSYVQTNNIKKVLFKIRRVMYRIHNINENYIHYVTSSIIKIHPQRVVMEDINIEGLLKNRHLSRQIQEQRLQEVIRQMKYKCEFHGIEFLQVPMFYPSSKLCSSCGKIKHDLKLSDRIYKCNCGNVIDRDYNAALNLMRYIPNLTK